jgi:hypothetical protein
MIFFNLHHIFDIKIFIKLISSSKNNTNQEKEDNIKKVENKGKIQKVVIFIGWEILKAENPKRKEGRGNG